LDIDARIGISHQKKAMATLPKIAQYFKFSMTIEKKKLAQNFAQLSHFICKSTTMFYM